MITDAEGNLKCTFSERMLLKSQQYSNQYAPMVELVDTLVLEASASASEFESRLGHQLW